MKVTNAKVVEYRLPLGENEWALNQCIGEKINLRFTGRIFCVQCGRKTPKSYNQGYCFPCMTRLNECGNCIIHPERCRVEEEGSCPKDDWAHEQCHLAHFVYLANSSHLKVGITRQGQIPTRWIDQGAMIGIVIARVSNRRQAGRVEMAIKKHVSDRTNWRTMLKEDSQPLDLESERERLLGLSAEELQKISSSYKIGEINFLRDQKPVSIRFPSLYSLDKVKSYSLDKVELVQDTLLGIKGQYLVMGQGVINIRKFSGYEVGFHVG